MDRQSETMGVDIDAVFKEIGEFGPYQRRIYFLLCLPAMFVGAANMAQVFIAATPKYRCIVPMCDANISNPLYNQPFLNFTIPYDAKDESWDGCHRYQRLHSNHSCTPEDFSKTATEQCPEGKAFSTDTYLSTIVSEYDLTCKAAWEAQMSQTIFFGGVMAGSFIYGIVGDLIGRKKALAIAVLCMAVSGTVCALVAALPTLLSCRFFSALMTTGVFQIAFLLGVEMVGPTMRVPCGIIIEYFYAVGEVLLSLISWWSKDWRMIQLVISAPVSCFVLYWWFIPESPRWLQAQGKDQKALALLKKIAEKNNKDIEPVLQRLQSTPSETEDRGASEVNTSTKVTLLDVVKTPLLCVRVVFMCFIWMSTALVYYGLSLNVTSLNYGKQDLGPYADFIFISLMEIPGYTLSWLGMTYMGRKSSLAVSMAFAGILCSGAGFSQEYNTDYLLALTLLGKCFITSSFGIIYVFTPEICPTSVRSTILGICSTFSRIGSMLAPFSKQLGLIFGPLPLLVFGGLSLVAAAFVVVMPETKKTELPDTIEEALNLGRIQIEQVPAEVEEEQQHLLGED